MHFLSIIVILLFFINTDLKVAEIIVFYYSFWQKIPLLSYNSVLFFVILMKNLHILENLLH